MADDQEKSPEGDTFVKITQKEYDEYLQLRSEKSQDSQSTIVDANIPTPPPNDKVLPIEIDDAEPSTMIDDDVGPSIGWDFGLQGGIYGQDTAAEEDTSRENENDDTSGLPEKSEPKNLLFDTLCDVLQSQEQRHALCNLQGKQAQVIIDYLYTVLLEPRLPQTWLRRHCLIALYKLSKSSLLYPHCYNLKGVITSGNSRIGGGGYSDIYQGKVGETEICLKVVRLTSEKDASNMLRIYAKEAILWGQLRHPNIVPFYGLFYRDEIRRELCLVSPWMRHGDLGEYLRKHKSPHRASLSYDVVCGLGYLHKLCLIHSDLKAANILVNDLERALITDFGMSFVRTEKTLADVIVSKEMHGGSTRWTAPELLDEEAISTMASDVWALGCVLYQIMTGKIPFDTLKQDAQIIAALLGGQRPGVPVLPPTQPEASIRKEIVRCFERDPRRRPNCQEIMHEFQSAGILGGDEHAASDDALRKPNSLPPEHIGPDKSLDIEEVGKVFESLKTDIAKAELGDFLLELLSGILRNKELRTSLCKLQDDKAQVVVNYLSSVLLGPALTGTKLRRLYFLSLLELSRTSKIEPSFYALKQSIAPGEVQAVKSSADIYKAIVEGKGLCLTVVRRYSPDLKVKFKWIEILNRSLNHPNVVPLYGVYSLGEGENLCLVSPWMSHGNVAQYLKAFPKVSRGSIIYDVVSGLEYLHNQGLVHQNLTGANILVNDLQRACIALLGFSALVEGSDISDSGEALCYQAPEVALSGSSFTKDSDVWAFGCVCFEIMTKSRPFHRIKETGGVLVRRILEEHNADHKPGEVPLIFSDLTEQDVWKEVERCWLRKPSDRPAAGDIRYRLSRAGFSGGSGGFSKDDAEQERQHIRNQLGDSDPVDLAVVQQIFEDLQQPKQ